MEVKGPNSLAQFPNQAVPQSKKTDKWIETCIEAAHQLTVFREEGVRKSYRQKKINYDLVNNILTPSDISRTTDPWNINSKSFPATPQNYPIIWPKLSVLIGEEAKRKFDWRVRIGNDNVIAQKSDEITDKLFEVMEEAITNPNMSDKEIEEKVKRVSKWAKYDYQDIKEITGNNLLRYFWKTEELKRKFNEGFQDALISSEEIYSVDIIGNNPSVEKLSPLEVHTIRTGTSNRIEDSDIIVIERFLPIGQVIEKYYNELTPKQVKDLEDGRSVHNQEFISVGEREGSIMLNEYMESRPNTQDGLFSIDARGNLLFGGSFDEFGNVRVARVLWKSRRLLKLIKYYDEYGNENFKYRDEKYEPIEELGESLEEKVFVNEAYEGTKIGEDIYIKTGPRPVQYLDMDNPSKCHYGVVGSVYNIDMNQGMSFVDMMKPYQYLYNIFMYRTELAFAKSHGKVLKLDPSLIPDGMELDEYLHYMTNVGVIFEDPFTEANKKGKANNLSQLSRGSSAIDLSMSAYISQHLEMMSYVESQCGRIAGITPQREGQISQRETVGGVERSVTQSNHITERYFMIHDNVKKRVLEQVLETAQYCWKGLKSKKLQYVLDDFSTETIEIEGESFPEYNYDIHISHSQDDMELIQSLKELAHAGIQNDKLKFRDLLTIYHSNSVAEMRREIESSEEEQEKRVEEQQQRENELAQAQIQAQQEEKEQERVAQEIENAKDRKKDLDIEQMKLRFKERELQIKYGSEEASFDGDKKKLDIEKTKVEEEIKNKKEELRIKEKDVDNKKEIGLKNIQAQKAKNKNN